LPSEHQNSLLNEAALYLEDTKQAAKFKAFQEKYRDDPAGFVLDCLNFPSGGGPKPYQLEILEQLPKKKRISIRGPHGLGKTATAAWIVLWAVLTSEDVKTPTTASAWRQLTKYLWPEIHKWAARLNWKKIGREPFDRGRELLALSLKRSPTCEAFAVASKATSAELIEGAHARRIVYVFDEAKAIPDEIWDAAEGSFAGAGKDTKAEAFEISISTPGEPKGRFYQIQSRAPGYQDRWVRKVSKEEAIAAGQMSQEWAEARALQWGTNSPVYLNRVEGEFAQASKDSLIPLAWVEAAVARWQEWCDSGAYLESSKQILGVDVARYGGDLTVVAERYGDLITRLIKWGHADTMESAGRVKSLLKGRASIDVIGVGAGVVDRLREQGCDIEAVNFSEATRRTDKSGEIQMFNVRAAAWWGLRERLEPPSDVMLPPDDDLIGDLTAPKFKYTSGGKLKIEEKEEIRSRLGRSPDAGDAVALAFWTSDTGQRFEDFLLEEQENREERRKAFLGL